MPEYIKKWLLNNFRAVLFLIIVLGIPLAAQPLLQDVRVHGVRKGDLNRLMKAAGFVKKRPLNVLWPDSVAIRMLRDYQAQGFYQARIDSFRSRMNNDSSKIYLDLWFLEGKPVRIGTFEIVGIDSVLMNDIQRFIYLESGRLFHEITLRNDIEQILEFMENHGYPVAEITLKILDYHPDSAVLDLSLMIDTGPLIRVDGFQVKGNTITKTQVILREIRVEPGMIYCHAAIMHLQEDLQRLGFFDTVYEPEVYFFKNLAHVTVHIKEGNPNTLDGVVGYTPSNDPERPGYFTGRLHFLFRNLFGTGRFFEAFWEKKDKYSQAMRFGYEEPWFRGWPVHPGGYFTQEIRDTTYVDRCWRLRIRYTPWGTLSLSMEGGQREILPDSLGSVIYDLAKTRSWEGMLGIDYSTFDDPLNPRKGLHYHTAATFGRKRNLGPAFMDTVSGWRAPVHTRHVQVDAEFIRSILNRQAIFIGLHGQEVKSGGSYVPLSEQIRFGGTTSLRGYAEDMFRGSMVAWMNLEYRYLIGRRSRVFVFIDAGMYQRRERDRGLIREQKTGYGFGIRLETRLGVMGVDYGLARGDDFMQGKVHVGLVNQF